MKQYLKTIQVIKLFLTGDSMMSDKVLLWDFDGTLGYRKDGMWGASMIEALKEYDPETILTASDFTNRISMAQSGRSVQAYKNRICR